MTDHIESVRLQAERRRNKLLNRGTERISGIESGVIIKDVTPVPAAKTRFTETTKKSEPNIKNTNNLPSTPSTYRLAKGPRSCFILLVAIISVLVSLFWPNNRNAVFYELSKIAITNFCIMEIAIQAYEVRGLKILFSLGTIIPLIQLLSNYFTKKQHLVIFILLTCAMITYMNYKQKIDSIASLYQIVMKAVISNFLTIVTSFQEGFIYFSDLAVFFLLVAMFVVIVATICRITGHVRVY